MRTEVGLDAGIFDGYYQTKTGFVLLPVIRFEPRWYYNIKDRNRKGKIIKNNSANFLTINLTYRPDFFIISNYELNSVNQIAIIPKWGVRRNFGNNFTFESGIGVGYTTILTPGYSQNSNVAVDLHLRAGYTI